MKDKRKKGKGPDHTSTVSVRVGLVIVDFQQYISIIGIDGNSGVF